LSHLLNSPGNFTASKLGWVKEHEPDNFHQIYKIMLPGDYITFRLTNQIITTASGLSEGIFWDFEKNKVSNTLMDYFGFDENIIPTIVETFSEQGHLTDEMAKLLGMQAGIPVCYRAGDQPNNAFSLNVLNPGEVAATAGTSGVVYGVTEKKKFDVKSRVNTFLHVNNTIINPRLGILLCLNSVGILNSWVKQQLLGSQLSYAEMNNIAMQAPEGAEGLKVLPFGNGAERVLENKNIGLSIHGINLTNQNRSHLIRAMQEGIVFAFQYGLEIMALSGLDLKVIRAGHANMFLSKLFVQTLANISQASIELYNTDGAEGAARGAALGAGYYKSSAEAFKELKLVDAIQPMINSQIGEHYLNWKQTLLHAIEKK
jgi:xylulokinase